MRNEKPFDQSERLPLRERVGDFFTKLLPLAALAPVVPPTLTEDMAVRREITNGTRAVESLLADEALFAEPDGEA